jgi:hypothetical protein
MVVPSLSRQPLHELEQYAITRRLLRVHFCYNARIRPSNDVRVRSATRGCQYRQVIVMVAHYGRKNACF